MAPQTVHPRSPLVSSQHESQQIFSAVDPYAYLSPELTHLQHAILDSVCSSHPSLTEITQYYFLQPSKQLRPLIILLFARAANGLGADWAVRRSHVDSENANGHGVKLAIGPTPPDTLNDCNPNMPNYNASLGVEFKLHTPRHTILPPLPPYELEECVPVLAGQILPTQMRLAQFVEMVHVASLLHDDVLDDSPLRRGVPSAHVKFGNKMSVLAGDFLLSRAVVSLNKLGNNEIMGLAAAMIADVVEGELMQINDTNGPKLSAIVGVAQEYGGPSMESERVRREEWSMYLKKNYLKTASVFAQGVKAAVILGGVREGEVWREVAYAYGRNFGIAFQLVDDAMDYEEEEGTMGKPGGVDLKLRLTTAPALYAWEEHEEMGPLILRKFDQEGDVELARDLVKRSNGIERTRDLARTYAEQARDALETLPESDSKAALQALTEQVVKRKR